MRRRVEMNKKTYVLVFFVAVVLVSAVFSCSTIKGVKATKQVAGTVKDVAYETKVKDFKKYDKWMKVNDETVTGDQFGVLGPAHGGAEGFREIYINKEGEKVSKGRDRFPYPVGTIIVKETYANDNGRKGDLEALTVMVKRGVGYDIEHNNWEYMMVSPDDEVKAQGRVEMCIGCHAAAADTDWVFFNRRKR
jgi:hypothetical protein